MSDQLTLDIGPLVEVPRHPGESIAERFDRWTAANPWVIDMFVALADQARGHGATRIGGKHLVEVMRWRHRAATNDDTFALNNDFTSRLVRAAIARRPDLAPLFELRELRS